MAHGEDFSQTQAEIRVHVQIDRYLLLLIARQPPSGEQIGR